MWWQKFLILALRRLTQEDHESKGRPRYAGNEFKGQPEHRPVSKEHEVR